MIAIGTQDRRRWYRTARTRSIGGGVSSMNQSRHGSNLRIINLKYDPLDYLVSQNYTGNDDKENLDIYYSSYRGHIGHSRKSFFFISFYSLVTAWRITNKDTKRQGWGWNSIDQGQIIFTAIMTIGQIITGKNRE